MCFKFNYLWVLVLSLFSSLSVMAQDNEPEFVGEAYLMDGQGDYKQLDKEMAAYTRGISFKANSWDALSLEVPGEKAQLRIPQGQTLQLVVRAVDNNSDPLSIVSIYRLQSKRKKRKTILSENNAGTLMKSRTHTKNLVAFQGKKYGKCSYLLTINNIEKGEYGIVVLNPNNVDEKRVIVSCFGVD